MNGTKDFIVEYEFVNLLDGNQILSSDIVRIIHEPFAATKNIKYKFFEKVSSKNPSCPITDAVSEFYKQIRDSGVSGSMRYVYELNTPIRVQDEKKPEMGIQELYILGKSKEDAESRFDEMIEDLKVKLGVDPYYTLHLGIVEKIGEISHLEKKSPIVFCQKTGESLYKIWCKIERIRT